MDSLRWTKQFETGLQHVDQQHRRLVELVNQFGDLTSQGSGASREQVEALFVELATYAQVHFRDEEVLMGERGIKRDYLCRHRAEHEAFIRQVGSMRAVTEQSAESTRALLGFLINWLAFHILGSDHQMAEQLALLDQGKSADEAFAVVVHDENSSSNLLLGAVDDLLRLLGQRNAELVAANDLLEVRVAARTAELSKALEELRRTQADLVHAQKLESVGQLAAGIAHELNTPLQFVQDSVFFVQDSVGQVSEVLDAHEALSQAASGRAELAPELERVREVERTAELGYLRLHVPKALARAKEGIERMASLVRSMKEFAQPKTATPEPTDLNDTVETTLAMAKGEYRAVADVVLRLNPLPPVSCFVGELNQVILSLIVNAAHAICDVVGKTGNRGTLTVETALEGEQVRLSISDTGTGIPLEIRTRIFDPFFTTKPVGKGTGQGLAIAYSVVTRHGGTITFDTEVGRGTTFHVRLPRVSAAKAA